MHQVLLPICDVCPPHQSTIQRKSGWLEQHLEGGIFPREIIAAKPSWRPFKNSKSKRIPAFYGGLSHVSVPPRFVWRPRTEIQINEKENQRGERKNMCQLHRTHRFQSPLPMMSGGLEDRKELILSIRNVYMEE